jgi:hypothetical protein
VYRGWEVADHLVSQQGKRQNQKNVLVYEVLPFLVEQDEIDAQILWCPCPRNAVEADFRQDAQEVLDGFEKLEEFNNRYSMRFSMGLAKLWLPRGEEWDVERVYICRLSTALDMIGYFYANCRVLALGNFTTTTDERSPGEVVDVENHGDRKFVAREYLDRTGYRLKDYNLRTVRQRVRKLFLTERVQPEDWLEEKAKI